MTDGQLDIYLLDPNSGEIRIHDNGGNLEDFHIGRLAALIDRPDDIRKDIAGRVQRGISKIYSSIPTHQTTLPSMAIMCPGQIWPTAVMTLPATVTMQISSRHARVLASMSA